MEVRLIRILSEPPFCDEEVFPSSRSIADVEFGGNFVAKIEEGLREADLTVLFWSPEAARSGWTQLEWTSVTAREISESRTRLGIVLLRDYAVPELLRTKHRI